MGTKWSMPIAVIGKPTGDGRQFDPGALSHRDLPLALRYVPSDSGGHKDAVVVGRIDTIGDEADGRTPATGVFYDGEEWPEDMRQMATTARMLVKEGVIGPSVDLDEADMERRPLPSSGKLKDAKLAHSAKTGGDCGCSGKTYDAEAPHINIVTRGRIASATLVHIPAFAELAGHAVITMADEEPAEDFAIDKGVGGGVDRAKLKTGDFGDPAGRKFPIVTAQDVTDAATLIGHADDPEAVKARIIAIAKRKGFESAIPAAWQSPASMTAAATALAAPPAAWFAKPDLDGPTPLTISDTGRVFGHVAAWGTCHVGIGDRCIMPPKSKTGYAYFHTGEVVTAEGQRVPVGRLTYGGGHAAGNAGYRAAAAHYDDSCHGGAVVRAGEDEYGIWVAGAMVPEADESTYATMRRTPLSGDWRRIGGNLELVAALHVNTAGFPIPRSVVSSAEPQSLVAAGVLIPAGTDAVGTSLDPAQFGRDAAAAFVAERDRIEAARLRHDQLIASLEDHFYADLQAHYAESRQALQRMRLADL